MRLILILSTVIFCLSFVIANPYSFNLYDDVPTGNITINNITIINGSSYNSSYVPYTGATGNVDLGTYSLTTTGFLGVGGINDNAAIPTLSIDPNNRYLYDSGGSIFLNWETYTLYDSLGVSSIDTDARYLFDALGNLALDWSANGVVSFDNNNIATTGTVTAEHLKTTDDLEVADDILLGSGSVMNWNVGDITLTHSLNTLTYAGMNTLNLGTSAMTTTGTVTAGTLASDSHTSQNNEFSYTANALGAGTKSFLPLMMDIYSDPFAFKPISALEYWNGTAWVAWAGATGQELIDGNSNTVFYADVTHAKWRITIQTGSYLMAGLLHFERSWVNGGVSGVSGAKGFDYLVEDSTTAGGTYTTIASGTFTTYSSNSINSQVMLTRHNTAGFWRVTIDASATLSGTERLGFHNMKLLTSGNLDRGYFRGNPWSTSYDKTVTFAGSVSVDSDTAGIILGDGQDAKIHYDGTNLLINPKVVGSGYLNVQGQILADDKILLTQTDGNEYIDSLNDGYVDIGATTGIRLNSALTRVTGDLYVGNNAHADPTIVFDGDHNDGQLTWREDEDYFQTSDKFYFDSHLGIGAAPVSTSVVNMYSDGDKIQLFGTTTLGDVVAYFLDGTTYDTVRILDGTYSINANGNAYFSGDVQADSFTEFSNLYSYDTTTAKEDLTSWISGEHPIQLSKNETESRAIISGEIKNKTVGTDIGKAGKATVSITLDNAKRLERYDSCLSSSKDFIEYKLCVGGLTG